MKRRLAFTILMGLFLATAAQAQSSGKKLALLVGVKNYEHAQLDALKFTENDATDLAKVLKDSGYTVVLMTETAAKDDVKLKPTLANIREQLKTLTKGGRRDDTVMVGLSGHGIQFEDDTENYFCPINARPVKKDKDTLLAFSEILKTLSDNGIGVKFLLVDACRNDPNSSRSIDTAGIRPPKGSGILFSCSKGQRAFESAELKHGVFFHYVLQGLKGGAVNAKGEITWSSLTEYVSDHVTTEVPKLIGDGARQEPNAIADLQGKSPTLVNKTINPEALKLYARGLELFRKRQWQQAFDELDKAVKLESRDAGILALRGACLVQLLDLPRAEKDLDAALKIDPINPTAYNEKGNVAFQRKDYDEAITFYSKALRLVPDFEVTLRNRADTYRVKGEYDRAIKDANAAARIDSTSAEPHNLLGQIYQTKGDFDAALRAFDKAVQLQPKSAKHLNDRAICLLAKGDRARAEQDALEATRVDGSYALAWNTLGNIQYGQRNYAKAAEHYTKAFQQNPKDAMLMANRANAKQQLRLYDEVLNDTDAALRINPDCAEAYKYRGLALMEKKDYTASIQAFDKAVALAPEAVNYRNRGHCQIFRKQFDQAHADLDQSIKLNPKDDFTFRLKGDAYSWMKDNARARAEYTKAIALNPNVASYYDDRAGTNYWLNDFDAALKDFDEALRLDRSNHSIWNRRGVILLDNKKKPDEALQSFNKAIELNSSIALYFQNRALTYDQLGKAPLAAADRAKASQLSGGK